MVLLIFIVSALISIMEVDNIGIAQSVNLIMQSARHGILMLLGLLPLALAVRRACIHP